MFNEACVIVGGGGGGGGGGGEEEDKKVKVEVKVEVQVATLTDQEEERIGPGGSVMKARVARGEELPRVIIQRQSGKELTMREEVLAYVVGGDGLKSSLFKELLVLMRGWESVSFREAKAEVAKDGELRQKMIEQILVILIDLRQHHNVVMPLDGVPLHTLGMMIEDIIWNRYKYQHKHEVFTDISALERRIKVILIRWGAVGIPHSERITCYGSVISLSN